MRKLINLFESDLTDDDLAYLNNVVSPQEITLKKDHIDLTLTKDPGGNISDLDNFVYRIEGSCQELVSFSYYTNRSEYGYDYHEEEIELGIEGTVYWEYDEFAEPEDNVWYLAGTIEYTDIDTSLEIEGHDDPNAPPDLDSRSFKNPYEAIQLGLINYIDYWAEVNDIFEGDHIEEYFKDRYSY